MSELLPTGYDHLLDDLKARIRHAQVKAALAVNRELVLLYWQIGRTILQQQEEHGWGAKVIERLAGDLRREFPDMGGFSQRNLKYMRRFAHEWPDEQFVQQAAAQIPWFHNCVILDKVADATTRGFYVLKGGANDTALETALREEDEERVRDRFYWQLLKAEL